jgi:hypothetical protein
MSAVAEEELRMCPLTNAEVWDIIDTGRSDMKRFFSQHRSIAPNQELLLEEVRVLCYLREEGLTHRAQEDPKAKNSPLVAEAIRQLKKLTIVQLKPEEILQLINLRATAEYEVYTVIPDLDSRCTVASEATAAILDTLRPISQFAATNVQ